MFFGFWVLIIMWVGCADSFLLEMVVCHRCIICMFGHGHMWG